MGDGISILPVEGVPEVKPGDDLSLTLISAIRGGGRSLNPKDVLVVAQKIVSKAEGRLVRLDDVRPSLTARRWAEAFGKDPRMVEVALSESKRVVRMERGVLILETRHGFVCANAGVDHSNVAEGVVSLLPEDPDGSAYTIRLALEKEFSVSLAVIISDTFGRPWREGLVNVAIGVSGMAPVADYRGSRDWMGAQLRVTTMAVADEVASSAELVMGKDQGIPAAIVRGVDFAEEGSNQLKLTRPPELDLFR
ncbi:MAG: coenzyme F420-0:L-glutamate ligase [Blastocatellia bacterium AA13]|nr:MAG: coenzyme F420-0:L-glutamate ligase [Blastocatellia bacterium AA13]